ncbi:cation:proton antiporter [bacterium]|nr:cation:proton antiporter [bacterium]
MEASEFFLKLLLLFICAKVFAEAFAYLKLPSVIGEVIAGIVIGPSLLGIIAPEETLYLLAEIGILLLLFEVGLETDVGQVLKVGGQATSVAITGILAPALLGFWISYYVFGIELIPALFISGCLVATSIGITVRVLGDLGKQHTRTARVVIGAAVIDDIVGVVLLALLYDLVVKGQISVMDTSKIVIFIIVFLLVAPVLAKLLVPVIAKFSKISRTKGLIPTIIISMILGLAVISHEIGAPEMLGSFAAGIALARRFFLPLGAEMEHYSKTVAKEVEESMKPIIDLFVPIFFVMVGVSINFKEIDFASTAFWSFAGALTLVAIIGKLASGIWVKGTWVERFSTGLAMVPRGEVGLIFAEVGKRGGVFDENTYAVIVFMVAFTTLLAPLALRFSMKGIKAEEAPA